MTFGQKVLDFHQTLQPNWRLPKGFELLFPYHQKETQQTMQAFYNKYYADQNPRIFLLGINPGRFGAGVTGVPFTDPIRLAEDCKIDNPFHKRSELSSIFIYEMIHAFGGPKKFNTHCYISSICPLGFVTKGVNCNYYDDKKLQSAVEKHIINNLKTQIEFGLVHKSAIILGQGKNYKYIKKLNEKIKIFDHIFPLPHPRWIMQYRRKKKENFIQKYLEVIEEVKSIGSIK